MKRTLALLTSAVMFTGFLPVTANATVNNGIGNDEIKEILESTKVENITADNGITLGDALAGDIENIGKDIVIHKESILKSDDGISLYSNEGSIRNGNLNNTVVNIKFKGEGDFLDDTYRGTNVRTVLDAMYNTSNISLNEYYKELSFGDLNVTTNIIGSKSNNEVSVELDHDRNYYMPYDPVSNPEGYFDYVLIDGNDTFVANLYDCRSNGVHDMDPSDGIVCLDYYYENSDTVGLYQHYQASYREEAMIYEVSEKLNDALLADHNLDLNNDGEIDGITFLIGAEPGNPLSDIGWSDLLWPHQVGMDLFTEEEAAYYGNGYNLDFSLLTEPCTINGKRVNGHNLYTSTYLLDPNYKISSNEGDIGQVGVICHEFGHTLGFPDYYSYKDQDLVCVGKWDLMDITGYVPQYINSVLRNKAGWLSDDQLKEITEDGEYELSPVTSIGRGDTSAYIVRIPGYDDQYFMFEYRKAEGSFDGGTFANENYGDLTFRNIDQSGLVLYRVDDAVVNDYGGMIMPGNFTAPPYNLYAFRQEYTYNSVYYSALDGVNLDSFGSADEDVTDKALTIQQVDNYAASSPKITEVNSRVVINNVSIDEAANKIKFTVDAKDPSVKNTESKDNKIVVTFDEKIQKGTKFDDIKLLLNGEAQPIKANINDKTLEISLKDGELNGEYTVKIPKNSVVDAAGKTIKEDYAKKITVTASTVSVSSVTLDQHEAELTVGNELKLSATVLPENASNKNVIWTSSDEAVAKVANDGTVTALSAGEAVITVKTDDGNFTDTCNVKVSNANVAAESVTLDESEISLTVGGNKALTATVLPEDATNKNVSWLSSDEAVAKVDNSGLVTGIAAGEAVITVTTEDGGFTAECTVKVTEAVIAVESVSLDKSELDLTVGSGYTLNAKVLPENATDKTVTWSSDNEDVATVDENGKVTAKAAGTAKITVKTNDGAKEAECTVKVTEASGETVAVTGVTLDLHEKEMIVGDSVTLNAIIEPADATNKNVSWESDNDDIVKVEANGKVTAVAAGTAIVTVTTEDGNFKDTCTITVEEPVVEVTGVVLDHSKLSINVDESKALTATVLPENATNKAVTWKSDNEAVATVDNNGNVTGIAAGTAVIKVVTTDGNFEAACTVTVNTPVVVPESVELDKTTAEMTIGDEITLTATVKPENAANKAVKWSSSNEAVATVDQNGKVKAIAEGNIVITVATEEGNVTATCEITVKKPVVVASSVVLNKTEAEITVGDTLQLTATVLPEDAADKTIVWTSSDEKVAKVDADGKVTAIKAGEVEIKASSAVDGVNAVCKLTVKAKTSGNGGGSGSTGNGGSGSTGNGTGTGNGSGTGNTGSTGGHVVKPSTGGTTNKVVTTGKGSLPATGAVVPMSLVGLLSLLGGTVIYKKKSNK